MWAWCAAIEDRTQRRRALLAGLEAEAGEDEGDDPGAAERVAGMEAELEQLAQDRHERLARDLEELEARRAAAAAELERLSAEADRVGEARRAADAAADAARRTRREVDAGVERARREAAKVGAELAAVNQFLRSHVGAPGGAPALADALRAEPGYELALAAALGPRLRAAVAANLFEAGALLDRAGKDGGAALVPAPAAGSRALHGAASPAAGSASGAARGVRRDAELASSPAPGAEPLRSRVRPEGDGAAASLAERLLANVWVVERLDGLRPDFRGVAVTRSGRVWSPLTRELRQVPGGGEDRLLAERNRRDELVQAAERAAQAEHAAIAEGERASQAVAAADAARDEADRAARTAARARDEASEAVRHAALAARPAQAGARRGPDRDAPRAARRRAGGRAPARRARGARAPRPRARLARERARLEADDRLAPVAQRLVGGARGRRRGRRRPPGRAPGRARRRPRRGRAPRRRPARRRRGRERRPDPAARQRRGGHPRRGPRPAGARPRPGGRRVLSELATKLGLDPEPAGDPLPEGERDALAARIERLQRRREQLGPVNPLAQDEYAEAIAHVEELEARREDLEDALRELKGLIRDTDIRIREAFEETFTRRRQELRGGRRAALPRRPRPPAPRPRGRRPAPGARRRRARGVTERRGAARADRRVRGERRPRRRHGRRDRDHARRQVDQAPDAALRRREVADRARVPVRGLPRPAVPVLHPRRGRGRARRPQHRPLPQRPAPLLRPRAVHRRDPPEAHDGGSGLPLRRLHGGQRRVEGRLAAAAAARRGLGPAHPRAEVRLSSRRR